MGDQVPRESGDPERFHEDTVLPDHPLVSVLKALHAAGRVVDFDFPEEAPKEAVTHELREAGVVERLMGATAVVEEDSWALDGGPAVR
eukprot:13854407-Alexandrium_andersonii.AAC.1